MPQRNRGGKRQQRAAAAPAVPAPTVIRLPAASALALPVFFTALLAAFALLPSISGRPPLQASILGASAALLAWAAGLAAWSARRSRMLALEISVRQQHYLQACAQAAILVYWGMYWPEVPAAVPLIAAQLVFAYAFEALLAWSQRDTHTLGFGPFPVIFSTNLFLWFKPDWFYLQFVMIAVGFAAKGLIRWTKDGRRVHIFNPSSFTLSLFSLGLIVTGSTHLTWGPEIATTQLLPPYIYLLIFLVSLPGQFLFGVALMTLSAVATTYVFGAIYSAFTGTYYFIEPSVPIAVFLGMHLLFTDPSTSPRTESGRVIFGVLYGLSVIALVWILEQAGAPTFYDKLLGVPLLNLAIQLIDRGVRSPQLRSFDLAAVGRSWPPRRRHTAFIAAWAILFALIQVRTATDVALARGDIFLYHGRVDEALASYREFAEARPDEAVGHNKIGTALLRAGRAGDALPALRRAADLQRDDAVTHNNLGLALLQTGDAAAAARAIAQAVTIRPDYAEAHYNLAQAQTAANQPARAGEALREALQLRPDWPAAMGALAWLQVTHADPGIYDPENALRLARRAADLSGGKDVAILDALAAAYAAAGRFAEAARTAEDAVALAEQSAPQLADNIRARLARYRSGRALVPPAR